MLARFEKFTEGMLDFDGIDSIGQAFADEIFRVFRQEHPEIHLISVRTSLAVKEMIAHVTNRGDEADVSEKDDPNRLTFQV